MDGGFTRSVLGCCGFEGCFDVLLEVHGAMMESLEKFVPRHKIEGMEGMWHRVSGGASSWGGGWLSSRWEETTEASRDEIVVGKTGEDEGDGVCFCLRGKGTEALEDRAISDAEVLCDRGLDDLGEEAGEG